ncbi:unnamed protein product [Nippostrongylus brasiliensis]|uniref:GED domain-containing protein n=1 Tax=Nippostrongylus brasiliensis TaxID=27835 RepID=A0A0N4XDX1_NIPBR|nr:hypothetical protein Q1695_007407 [Nippostrongylus brasiliensis]VDL63670.1 unnamed protein product [Nippostrongylus brasiliensis]
MFNILLSMAKEGSSECPQFTTPGRSSRDNLINTVYKLHRTRLRILEPYRKLKNALKQLQEDYLKSKSMNPIMRYMKLQQSVREVVIIEKQYWKLLDIPNQDGSEDSNEYVVRIIQLLEVTSPCPPSGGGIGALLSSTMMGRTVETRVDQSLYDSIKSRKTEELQKDCEMMYQQLYKLIRKYQGLRKIIKYLHDKYDASRLYPIVPRYPILKKMIKTVLRAPEFADICHEQTE